MSFVHNPSQITWNSKSSIQKQPQKISWLLLKLCVLYMQLYKNLFKISSIKLY